jgi:hypothetical protein
MLQLPFGAMDAPAQVSVSEKSPVLLGDVLALTTPTLLTTKVLDPVLTRVMVCGALAVPTS